MAGAIAGTAIVHAPEATDELHTVTLTVNNSCNLECPHCYLQYNGRTGVLSEEHAQKVLESDFKHLAIVGKEPTLHPELLERLVLGNKNRKTSIITNGTRLATLSDNLLQSLDYVDVSFDGGPKTYSQRRKVNFGTVIENLKEAHKRGARRINALHTLYNENLGSLDDMIAIEECFDFGIIAFSPYKVPHNHGEVFVTKSSLVDKVLPALASNSRFVGNSNTVLLVSRTDLTSRSSEQFFEQVSKLGLARKIHYTEDPLNSGLIRVNYDGRVLKPDDSVHPLLYDSRGCSLDDSRFKDLNDVFREFRREESALTSSSIEVKPLYTSSN